MRHRPDPSPALLARYPHLVPRTQYPNLSEAALAAKNLRIELRRAFPTLRFSVTSEYFSGGCTVRAVACVFKEDMNAQTDIASLSREAAAIAANWEQGNFDAQTDGYDYRSDPDSRAFLDAFGGARFAGARCVEATPTQESERRKKLLEKSLAKPASKKRGLRL